MTPAAFIKRFPYLVLGIVLLLVGGIVLVIPEPMSDRAPAVSDTSYLYAAGMRFELADTPAEREQGLSGRTEIPEDYGMLFVFEEKGLPGFWMKDMLVPIDIIWLADDGTILGIERSVSPSTYPAVFYAPEPVQLVLETRAGHAREAGWDTGTRISLPNRE